MDLADWKPAKLRAVATRAPGLPTKVRVPVSMLPKLRVPHPAWILAGFVGEIVLREIYTHATLMLNGLSFSHFCRLVGASGYNTYGPTFGAACLTGLGTPANNMSRLISSVPTLAPGAWVEVSGFSGFHPVTFAPQYASQSYYRVIGTTVGGVRPRPYVAPNRRYFEGSVPYLHARYARPGQVPAHVRPWPVWSRPLPVAQPAPTPTYPEATKELSPPWSWAFQPGRTISRPIPGNPAIPRNPPAPNTREVKIGANTRAGQLFFQIMRAREALSEFEDFAEVIFRALPKNIQRLYGGRNAPLHKMLQAIFDNAHEIDGQLFIRNLIANQIEDEIIGRTWFKARAMLRNILFPGSMGSTGPVNNPAFQEYAKAVSGLADLLANEATGLDRNGDEYDRRLADAYKRVRNAWAALTG